MYQKILVPVDGSETSNCGLNEAIKLAKNQGGQICLLHIVNELILDYGYGGVPNYGDIIESMRSAGNSVLTAAEASARQSGLDPESVLLESNGEPAADLIIAQAKMWSTDLIVMGTHGRRGIRRLVMGSDAESVVRESPVPVLLVHSSINAVAAAKTNVLVSMQPSDLRVENSSHDRLRAPSISKILSSADI